MIYTRITGGLIILMSLQFQALLCSLLRLPECFHQKRFCDESQDQNVPLGVLSLRRLQETSRSASSSTHPCQHSLHSQPFFVFPVPGDEFALHGEGIYCKEDHELLERCEDNNNLEPKQQTMASPRQIKTELEDFRDNLSDLGREEDSYRSVLFGL